MGGGREEKEEREGEMISLDPVLDLPKGILGEESSQRLIRAPVYWPLLPGLRETFTHPCLGIG